MAEITDTVGRFDSLTSCRTSFVALFDPLISVLRTRVLNLNLFRWVNTDTHSAIRPASRRLVPHRCRLRPRICRTAMPRTTEHGGLIQDTQSQDVPEMVQEISGTATEHTPLLADDVPLENRHSRAGRRKVILICALLLFVVDAGANIMEPPTNQLMEDVICRDYFPDHALGREGFADHRCKERHVQKDFTMLKSVIMFTRTLCRTSSDNAVSQRPLIIASSSCSDPFWCSSRQVRSCNGACHSALRCTTVCGLGSHGS